jgi:hypothetical protein
MPGRVTARRAKSSRKVIDHSAARRALVFELSTASFRDVANRIARRGALEIAKRVL